MEDELELNTTSFLNAVSTRTEQAILNGLMVQDLDDLLPIVNAAMEVNKIDNDDMIDPNIPQEALDFPNRLKIAIGMEVASSEPEDINLMD